MSISMACTVQSVQHDSSSLRVFGERCLLHPSTTSLNSDRTVRRNAIPSTSTDSINRRQSPSLPLMWNNSRKTRTSSQDSNRRWETEECAEQIGSRPTSVNTPSQCDGGGSQSSFITAHQSTLPDSYRQLHSSARIDIPKEFSDPRELLVGNNKQSVKALSSLKSSFDGSVEARPFRRWLSTLRRRRSQDPKTLVPRKERWTLDDFDTGPKKKQFQGHSHHRQSHSNSSSLAFVTAVKPATATLASASIAAVSRRGAAGKSGCDRDLASLHHDFRPSIDGVLSTTDISARLRSRKRREKLEELIRTEESYVADLKALSDVST
jgi:hypothetical protein